MPDIRESIDEMIEESYLVGLTEGEIRADMERFVSICGRVIRENVHDKKQTRRLTEQLARARALSLVEDASGSRDDSDLLIPDAETRTSPRGRYAERAARNKRLILRVIRECDPKLEQLIEQERFSGSLPEPSAPFSTHWRQRTREGRTGSLPENLFRRHAALHPPAGLSGSAAKCLNMVPHCLRSSSFFKDSRRRFFKWNPAP